jgi:addiction module HigA family antidote
MREILEDHVKMSVAEAARRLRVSRPALYAVLNGTSAVTAEMALRFTRLTGGSPDLYLQMQVARDLWRAAQRLHDELAEIEPGDPTVSTSIQRDYGRLQPAVLPPIKRSARNFDQGRASLSRTGRPTAPQEEAVIARSLPKPPRTRTPLPGGARRGRSGR